MWTSLLLVPAAVLASGLLDAPLVSTSSQYLDGVSWTASNNGSITIDANVPGDLVTDLQRASVIGDPLYELNFKSVVWDATDFTYSLLFDADASVTAMATRWLVLDGVKMGSNVWLNGVFLGQTADQFLRYTFDVTPLLLTSNNSLSLTFPPSNDSINDEARWMAWCVFRSL